MLISIPDVLSKNDVADFRRVMAADGNWQKTAVVTHWGFIRALTGLTVGNGTVVRYTVDPAPAAKVVHPA